MVEAVLAVFQVLVVGLAVYNLLTALAGWANPSPAPPGARSRRFVVVVPAHDEERVVANLVGDLFAQDHPADLFEVWVLADHCSDATAGVATAAGAAVATREDGEGGKGAALGWFLERHPLAGRALVVLDADNRVPPDLLTRFSDELDAGHHALQAYLDVSNPDRSMVTVASALSYWASNRMVQLSRRNLGWTADLGGTGMCLTAEAIEAAGGFGTTMTEDQEMGVRLFEAGVSVVWLHDVKVADEKPAEAVVAVRQRARWASGRRAVARAHTARLLRMRSLAAFDLALRLNQPSRMGMAMVSAILAVLASMGAPFWDWRVWAGAALVQLLVPVVFLIRDRVPARYLWRYPVLVILPPIKLGSRLVRNRGWFHTPHSG